MPQGPLFAPSSKHMLARALGLQKGATTAVDTSPLISFSKLAFTS